MRNLEVLQVHEVRVIPPRQSLRALHFAHPHFAHTERHCNRCRHIPVRLPSTQLVTALTDAFHFTGRHNCLVPRHQSDAMHRSRHIPVRLPSTQLVTALTDAFHFTGRHNCLVPRHQSDAMHRSRSSN